MANLNRQIRKPRFPNVSGGQFGRLVPFHYHPVFSGESQHNIKTSLTFQSVPINAKLAGCTIDVWYYYVPHRLIWTDFPTWLMGDSTLTVPNTNTVAGNALFNAQGNQDGSSEHFHFLASGYEKVVNQFFREEHDQYAISSTPAVLPIVDRTAETQGDEDYEEEDETIDVSSGTLSLKEVERKRAQLAYERRVESLDGKYTSWLRAQGVNANEAIAQIPEFLGHYRKYVKPQQTVKESDGLTVQHYKHECNFSLSKRRYFQEHGNVIGVYSMRPKIHLKGGYNQDSTMWYSPEQMPHVGQLAEHKKIAANMISKGGYENEADGTPETYLNIDHYLWSGRMHTLVNDNTFVNGYDPTDDETALYPSTAWDAAPVSASTRHFVADGVCSTKIATPLRRLKVM